MITQFVDILKQMHFPLEYEYFMRLIFALGAGSLVGIEREYRGRPAGMRNTYSGDTGIGVDFAHG